jgi:hypothetical protein
MAVLLGTGWPAAAEAPPLGQRVEPVDGRVVVDAQGRVLGPLVQATGGFGVVLFRASGRDALLFVGREQILGVQPAQYEAPDCSGPPLVEFLPGPARVAELAAVGTLGEILVPVGDAETRSIGSRWVASDLMPFCDTSEAGDLVVRPTVVLSVAEAFTPPFRLR